MSDTIQQVATMTETLEASWCVDTHVVTSSIKGALVYVWKSEGLRSRVCLPHVQGVDFRELKETLDCPQICD